MWYEKSMTFHLARYTFATTITLDNDVPIESVSEMLGHTSLRTTQIYAKMIIYQAWWETAQLHIVEVVYSWTRMSNSVSILHERSSRRMEQN